MLRRIPRIIGRNFRKFSLVHIPKRAFSEELTKITDNLSKALDAEIEHENEQVADPVELSSFLNETGWQCTAKLNSTKVEMTKTVGDTKLTILFDARVDDSGLDEESGEKTEENDADEGIDFLLFVDRGRPKQMLFECISTNTQIEISSISVLPESSVEEIKKDKSSLFTKSFYAGPGFETLDEKLQEHISSYFNSLGINDQLGSFIESKAFEHENDLYKNWLKEFKDAVN